MGKFEIAVDDNLKIVRVNYEGQLDQETSTRLVSEARSMAYEHQYNLLYNYTKATISISYAEMYFFTRKHELLVGGVAYIVKSANVIPNNEDMKNWLFLEDTARNAGLNFRTFTEEQAALDWLNED